MGTVRTVHFDYAAPVDTVAALLQDPVYLRHRSESAGEYNIDVRVETRSDGVHVTIQRQKEVDLPAVIRAVVGSSNRAVEQTLWRLAGDRWIAEYTIEVSGIPGKVAGNSTLTAVDHGCHYTSTFEVSAPIPLLRKRIEATIAEQLVEHLVANAQRNADALGRGAQPAAHSYVSELREKSRARP